MMYGFGSNPVMDLLRRRLGQPPQPPQAPTQGLPPGGIPFEGGYNPYGGYKGGGGVLGGFPNPLARLQPFLGAGRRKRPGMGMLRPY